MYSVRSPAWHVPTLHIPYILAIKNKYQICLYTTIAKKCNFVKFWLLWPWPWPRPWTSGLGLDGPGPGLGLKLLALTTSLTIGNYNLRRTHNQTKHYVRVLVWVLGLQLLWDCTWNHGQCMMSCIGHWHVISLHENVKKLLKQQSC